MKGRRIPIEFKEDGKPKFPFLEQPGDYAGPVKGWSGDLPAVFFLKPNARDADAPKCARAIQHVTFPPHTVTEESDGTLTIRASLGDMHGSESDGWHGYLTKGVWEKF